MDALYSGQAGVMALLQGAEASILRADDSGSVLRIGREGVSYLFRGCTDVVHAKGMQESDLRASFNAAWNFDRALRIFLVALDPEEDCELRWDAADCLESLLSLRGAKEFIENEFFARILPSDTEFSYLLDSTRWPLVAEMLKEIISCQGAIRERRDAWDELPDSLFKDGEKHRFEEQAIRAGAFRVFASADLLNIDQNLAILRLYEALATLPNSRTIVNAWTANFKRPSFNYIVEPEPDDAREDEESSHLAYEHSRKQRDAIVETLKSGNLNLARKYTDRLVRYQLENGGPVYAAMSLCFLAQQAKDLHLYTLQLEWAQRAVDTNPSDAWAHGQAADALLQFSRLDEALIELNVTEKLGDAQFAATTRARILRHQGKLEDALAAFRSARERFRDHSAESYMWSGAAETLRDMWKLDEALKEYEQGLERFPGVHFLRCGRAAVLADLGRLDEAIVAYDARELRGHLIALNGKASALKDQGKLEQASEVVEEAIELYPADPIARCIQAEIMRLKGNYQGALQLYAYVRSTHPTIPNAYSGYAEVLRDLRRFPEAVREYEQAHNHFRSDARIANGYANIRKVNGDLEEALRIYERNVRQFPYDLVGRSGRADLLKRLGQYESAIGAYNQILNDWPDYEPARNGKAAILVVQGRFDEASRLLPLQRGSTRDGWIGWHIRGMILLRSNKLDEAARFFESAGKMVPFARERRFFQSALTVARLRQKNFERAIQALIGSGDGPLANVLRFHAYAGMQRSGRARVLYRDLIQNCPSQLVELRDAIAGHYGIAQPSRAHNDNWIFTRESEILLQEAA